MNPSPIASSQGARPIIVERKTKAVRRAQLGIHASSDAETGTPFGRSLNSWMLAFASMTLIVGLAHSADTATSTGLELGISGAKYDYKEPTINVKDDGWNAGVLATGTYAVGNGWYGAADYRGAYGQVDYTGSGTQKGEEIILHDGRLLLGHDMGGNVSQWSPYIGIGYRTLYNDARGITSTGARGYRRFNTMWYVPVGAEYRVAVATDNLLTLGFESDLVVSSEQKSYLSDAGIGERDIINKQRGGYGLRGNIGYGFGDNEIGAFTQYWDMNDSKRTVGLTATWLEPQNTTTEIGLYYKRRLW